MKHRAILSAIMIILVVAILSGCSGTGTEPTTEPRSVVDMHGKGVALPETVDSYCVLYSSAVPMCAMMDKNLEHMVQYPVSNYFAYWDQQMFSDLASHAEIVDKKNVTAEQIIESGAQVVFWSRASHEELVASLEAAGIACINLQTSSEEELFKAINIVADTFGTEYARSQADKYFAKYAEIADAVSAQASLIPDAEKKSILVLGDTESLTAYGSNTYIATWPKTAGLNFIAPVEDNINVTLTMEQIYEYDPDIIDALSIFDVEETAKDAAWNQLRAVKDGQLYSNPMVLDVWGEVTTETPLQLVWVLRTFYPEYLGDIDPIKTVTSFYSELYGYEMSEDDANDILNGVHRMLE